MHLIKTFLLLCLAFSYLFADNETTEKTPEQLQQELEEAEKELAVAKKMFNPWYAGPLLAAPAEAVPVGVINIQPYLFITDTHARYNSHRKSVNIPDIITINPTFVYQMGIVKAMDFQFIPQLISNHQDGHHATNLGDTKFGIGFQMANETLYHPAMKLVISETFPTGKYQRLNPKKEGVDATGAGSFQTLLGFNLSKIVFWFPLHPMRFRLNLSYILFAPVHVKGFNAYGGGFGTSGKVKPGNEFQGDLGIEFSFTQKWVFALDIVYIDQKKTSFWGRKGVDGAGNPAVVGAPSSDQLSLAPALQYNQTPDLGYLAGFWFTVRGRNSANFFSGILTFTYTF